VYEFSYSYDATVAGGMVSPAPAGSGSNIMPATQPTDTCRRKNTDKAAEAFYLVKLSLLGQKIEEIGESQAPQSESSPGSKLPGKYNRNMELLDLGLRNPSLTPIIAWEKFLVLRET